MTVTTSRIRQRSHRRDIEMNYPHQVAMWHPFCTMENFKPLADFCVDRFGERPECYIVYTVWEGYDHLYEDMRIFCFREPVQAEEFAAHFEGEPFDPKACQKGKTAPMLWARKDSPSLPIRHGPLSVPKWIRGRR